MIKSLLITAALASTLSACAYEYPSEKNLDDRPHADYDRVEDRSQGDVYYSDSTPNKHDELVIHERTYDKDGYTETVTTIEPVVTKRYYYRHPIYNHGRSTTCSPLKYKNGWC